MTMSRNRIRLSLVLAFALAVSVAMTMPPVLQPVRAAAFTVGPDVGDDFDNLVDAVNAANALNDFDTISVAPGTYTGLLFITADLTIVAEQPGTVVVDGGGTNRVIWIGDGAAAVPAVTLDGLQITGGSTGLDGGGILLEASSSLTLVDSWVHDNLGWDGGGLAIDGATATVIRSTFSGNTADDGEGGNGGGIAVEGSGQLNVHDSTISDNFAFGSGGGVFLGPDGVADVRNVTIVDNNATFGGGVGATDGFVFRNTIIDNNFSEVGLDCSGTLTSLGHNLVGIDDIDCAITPAPGTNDIIGTTFPGEDAELGPLSLNGGTTPTHLPLDGSPVIDSGDNVGVSTFDQTGIVSRTFDGTTDRGARERGGVTVCASGCEYASLNAALDAATNGEFILLGGEDFTENVSVDTNVVIQGEGMNVTVIDGDSSGRVIDIGADSNVVIRDLSITGGVTDAGEDGAGVRAIGSGSAVTLERVHIWGNDSAGGGGAVYTTQQVSIIDSFIDNNTAAEGGGGVGSSTPSATVDVIGTTVSDNAALLRGGGLQAADGTWNVLNSTITINAAPEGAGIWNDDGTFTLNNVTLWDNFQSEQIRTGGGVTRTANSIIASPDFMPDCVGSLELYGYNFISEDTDCLFDYTNSLGGEQIGDAFKLDPQLAPFGFYDADVPVLPLFATSDAVDAGNPNFEAGFPNCEATDQQGFDRGFDYPCDIGAVEGALVPFGTIQEAVDDAFAGDVIDVPPGLYVESVIVDKELTLNGYGVTISNELANQPTLTVFGPSVVTLNGFSLTDGEGGGLSVFDATASVILNDVLVENNANFSTGNGGGVINDGTLVMNGGSISFNTASSPFDGGGLFNTGTATLNGVIVEGNTVGNPGQDGRGGGIFNSGSLTVTGGSVVGGTATEDSGHTADDGGGIYNTGSLTVSNAAISNNDVDNLSGSGAGGGIYTTNGATITGTTIDGNEAITGGGVYNEGDLTVNGGSVFSDNYADSEEGGGLGGGIYSFSGIVDVDNAAFVDNGAFSQGGAIYSFADGVAIDNTSFDSNFAGFAGGALYLRGDHSSTMGNTTFAKNHTGEFGEGGAIRADDFHTLNVTGGAFRNNGAGFDGGAILTTGILTVAPNTEFTSNTAGYPFDRGGDGGAIHATFDEFASEQTQIVGATFQANGASAARSVAAVVDVDTFATPFASAACPGPGSLLQGFMPDTATSVDVISIQLRGSASRGGSTPHMRLRVGDPEGPILAEADAFVPGPLPVGSIVSADFVLPIAVGLAMNNVYYVEITDLDSFSWLFETGNPYPNGDAYTFCGASPVLLVDRDYHLQTKSSPTGVTLRAGGAIYNSGPGLALSNNDFIDNVAGRGGAIAHAGYDGGIFSVGDDFVNNRAALDGGAVSLGVELAFSDFSDAQFFGNRGQNGGAISADNGTSGWLSVYGSLLTGNFASQNGGAIDTNGEANVFNSTFEDNTAFGDGGAINVFRGSSPTSLNVSFGEIGPNLFRGNSARGNGGAIAFDGGVGGGSLEVHAAEFDNNTTGYDSGEDVIYDGDGGAIYSDRADTYIGYSAFLANSAANGGAVAATNTSSFAAENTTVSGNYADIDGGGMWLESSLATLDSLTIADNVASLGGGGIYAEGAPIEITNTILALNTSPNGTDCGGGGLDSTGFNLIGDDTGCSFLPTLGDIVGDGQTPIDPGLEPFPADNGGPTSTRALLEFSSAIDAGSTFLFDDQRFFDRPYLGVASDIGAFESEFAPVGGSVEVFIDGGDTTPVGASSVPIENIPSSALTNTNPDVIAGTPVGDVDVESTPINSIPVGSIPIGSIPVASIGPALDAVSLIDVPIEGGWESVLAGTTLDGPVHLYTLGDALDNAAVLAELQARGIDFGSLTIAAAPVASIPISSIVLGATPINSIPINSIAPGTAEHFEQWCLVLGFESGTGGPDLVACRAALGLPADATAFAADESVLSLALRSTPVNSIPVNSIPVSSIPINSIPVASIPVASIPINSIYVAGTPINSILLTDTPINSIPINSIPINSIDLAGTPVGSIPINSIPVGSIDLLFDCAATDCAVSTPIGSIDPAEFLVETYGQLLQVLFDAGLLGGFTVAEVLEGLPNNATVADLIAFLIPPEEYPWQEVNLDATDLATFASPPEVTTFFGDVALLDVFEPTDVLLDVTLPPGFTYLPGTAEFVLDGESTEFIEPIVDGDVLSWELFDQEFDLEFEFDAVSGLTVGPTGVAATAELPVIGAIGFGGDDLTVTEAFPNNDSPVAAVSLNTDTIYLSHIGSSDEGDFFLLPGVAAGSIINVSLSNLDVDLDLVLYGPDAPPLRGDPERRVNSVTDTGLDALEAGAGDPGSANDIPLEVDRDVVAISAQRGDADESIVTDPVAVGGDYIVQVTGYNGATSRDPYTLLPQIAPPAGADACASVPPVLGTQGQLPVGPLAASVNTLFLVHRGLLEAVYSADDAAAILAALDTFSDLGDLGVEAAVIEIDGDAAVQAATQTWVSSATAYCSIDNANAVASAAASVVDSFRATNPGIEYVVFVGGDDQVPQFRLPDATEIANESGYGTGLGGLITPQTAALSAGFLLSDEPYGDPNPLLTQDGREIYVSEVALGRLVESGPDILQTLANFTIFNGLLDPSTTSSAFVSGYDFLIDGAEAVEDELNDAIVDDVSGATRNVFAGLISDVWTAADLTSDLLTQAYTVVSFNAHFDHQRAEPADLTGGGLIEADDLDDGSDPFLRDIVFSMGCHSGFQASDFQVGEGGTGQTLPIADDWAQTIARQGGTFIGNTGYGYGDTDVVALSETLMTNFAGNLDGPVTVGRALNLAKHQYVAAGLTYGPYDDKVVHIATFYGLPFYKVGGLGDPAALADPIDTSVDGTTGLIAAEIDTNDLAGQLELRTGSRGQYYAFAEPGSRDRTQASPYRPIQPRIEVDVTQGGGLVARGALITGLASQDFAGFDPSVSRPIIELGSNEPEPVRPGIFPSVIQAVNRYLSATGLRDQLVLVPGQFRSDEASPTTGVQRLFTDIEAKVFYSDESDPDFDQPIIRRSTGTDLGDAVNFEVVTEPTDVVQVLVLYKTQGANGIWGTVQLTNQGNGVWTGSTPATGLQEFYPQVVDGAGNVGVHPNKGALHLADNEPVPPAASTLITEVSGSPLVDGWYRGPVTVTLNQLFGILEYQLDGGGLTPYDPVNGIPVTGDGPHLLRILSSGLVEEITIQIDATGPSITSPIDGATYLQNEVVPIVVNCSDGGSGVATCTPNGGVLDTSQPGPVTFGANASDLLGNSSQKMITYSVIAAPSAAIEEDLDTVPEGTPVTFTADTDAASPLYSWTAERDGVPVAIGSAAQFDFVADDDGAYAVTLVVSQDGVESDPAVETFMATNVAPVIGADGDATVALGADYLLDIGPVTDPGDDSAFQYVVNWGDGTSDTVAVLGPLTHSYPTLGAKSITVDVTDEDGEFIGVGSSEVTVEGEAATAIVDNVSVTVDEGNSATNSGTFTGLDAEVMASVGAVVQDDGAGTWQWSYSTTDGPDESQIVTISVAAFGSQASVNFNLNVDNVAPVADLDGEASAEVGVVYSVTVGDVVDPGDDVVTDWSIDWGDGDTDSFASAPGAADHTYGAPGDYTIVLSLSDEDGTYDVATLDVMVDAIGAAVCDTAVPTIEGTSRRDIIFGTWGADIIFAGAGNDVIYGLGGDDIICAGDGNDRVYADGGNDFVDGGQGNDRLFGGSGDDELIGGDGNDRVYGNGGDDLLEGGAGNDRLNGGTGTDTVTYENAANGVWASLMARYATGNGFDRVYAEHLVGSEFNDTLIGKAGSNTILGLGGDDDIYGRSGKDTLDGGPGTDSLNGGFGTDTCLNGESLTSCEL